MLINYENLGERQINELLAHKCKHLHTDYIFNLLSFSAY